MRTLALSILCLCVGCRSFCAYDPHTHVFLFAGSVLTSPAIAEAQVNVKTPTTQETLLLKGYTSKSEVTGSDLSKIFSDAAKILTLP